MDKEKDMAEFASQNFCTVFSYKTDGAFHCPSLAYEVRSFADSYRGKSKKKRVSRHECIIP